MYTDFIPDIHPPAGNHHSGLWFIFSEGRLLVKKKGQKIDIPVSTDIDGGMRFIQKQYIGALGDRPCYAAEVAAESVSEAHFEFYLLRSLFSVLNEEMIWLAGRANHLVYWQKNHQYCGACGKKTTDKKDERAKICLQCGLVNYPRLSPAVIVAVVKDNTLLLARNKRFKLPLYSVLAGFVEPSETLEQCVEREVWEEVGIRVKNIKYFGSQPWPFPDSLMVAFTADYAGGEIRVDETELTEANWYPSDAMPRTPPPLSIAGKLIEWFVKKDK